jgi:hypothetical protein
VARQCGTGAHAHRDSNAVEATATTSPERQELMDFNAGNIQTPQEMLERWDCIPCTCDPDVWHLCEICHDTEVVRRLMAQAIIVEGGIDDN